MTRDQVQTEGAPTNCSSPLAELREREEQYRSIFQSTMDGMAIVDLEGFVVEANETHCNMFGYEHDDLIGTHVSTLTHPDYQHLIEVGKRRVQAGEGMEVRLRALRKDGTAFYAESRGTLFTFRGEPHFLSVVRDVTEQVRAEEQYRSVFEATSDALLIADFDGVIVEANPAACALYGYHHDEIVGLHGTDFVHPDDQAVIARVLSRMASGEPVEERIRGRRKDGSVFVSEGRASLFSYRGRPHILSVGRDVTATVQMEERLREGEAQWRRIFLSSSDGLIINDPATGIVVEANPAVCRMHGYTYDEFLGIHATDFIHPDDHPVFEDFRRTIMAGGTYRCQAIDVRRDGTTFPVEVHGSGVLYQGRLHILAVVRDITERVASERAVLEERQRLSRELHDSVSQALYSVALGAKTARAVVHDDPVRAAEALDFTLAQVERGLAEMRALILELRPEALEQDGLVGALRKHADAVRLRHHIRVDARLEEEPALPLAMKEALYRIAQEALHNAVKHAGARTIRLSLVPADGEITLLVADDGKGFDRSASFPGHVGLQSMRERATHVGGTLQIESAPGVGTRILAAIPHPHEA